MWWPLQHRHKRCCHKSVCLLCSGGRGGGCTATSHVTRCEIVVLQLISHLEVCHATMLILRGIPHLDCSTPAKDITSREGLLPPNTGNARNVAGAAPCMAQTSRSIGSRDVALMLEQRCKQCSGSVS
jgi:hypothetical protein